MLQNIQIIICWSPRISMIAFLDIRCQNKAARGSPMHSSILMLDTRLNKIRLCEYMFESEIQSNNQLCVVHTMDTL